MSNVTKRDLVMTIILSIVTCGIYGIYWMVCITNDLNTLSGEESTSGVMLVVLYFVTCGIYGIYWAYKCGERLDSIKQSRGLQSSNSGVLYLIVFLFVPIVVYALVQNEINNLVD